MQKKELETIINTLQSNNLKNNDAKVGFYYMDHEDESYIRGNKAGLELLAVEFLKASCKVEQIESGEIETLYINLKNDWIDNQTSLLYIQPVANFDNKKIKEITLDWKYYTVKYTFLVIFGIAIISFIVGLLTIIKWLF